MDTRLLLTALQLLAGDYSRNKLLAKLQQVGPAAQTAAGSPTDPASQKAFSDKVDEVRLLLHKASTNTAPISIRKALEQLALSDVLPDHVEARLNGILSRVPFLLSQAAADLSALHEQLSSDLEQKVKSAIAALENLDVVPLQTDTSLAELGILLPTHVAHNDLITTNKNMREWQAVILHFEELTTGKTPAEIPIAAVSSGSYETFIKISADAALALAKLIGVLVGGFMALSRARKTRKQAETDHYPEKVLQGMKEYEETIIAATQSQAIEDIMKLANKALDSGRVNELRVQLGRDIRFVAKSISIGVDIEVSPPKLPAPNPATPATPVTEPPKIAELRKLTETNNSLIRALPTDRTEPLAELPDPDASAEAPNASLGQSVPPGPQSPPSRR